MSSRIARLFRHGLRVGICLCGLPWLHATTLDEVLQRHVDLQRATAASRDLFASGQTVAAEQMLFAFNRSKNGTPEWYVESATALMRMGFSFRQTGDTSLAVYLGQQALAQLAQAEQKQQLAADTVLAATVKELAGVINENLAGTTELAKAYYRAAIQLNPAVTTAAIALDRLTKADQEAALKQQVKLGGKG